MMNCTNVEQLVNIYLPVSYSLIFTVGLVGNITSISIYLTKLRPWKSSGIIMVNLALTDLLYVLTLPFLVYYYSNGRVWMLGDFMCRLVRFGFHFHLYGSILFLTCLAVFRFVVVIQPLRVAQVQRKSWGVVACLAVWIISAIEVVPMFSIISLKEKENQTCLDFASSINVSYLWEYCLALTTIGFALPLVVVSVCYIGIVKKLAKGPDPSNSHRIRARRVTVLILVVFVICFLPYHILRVLWIEVQTNEQIKHLRCDVHAAYIISRPLAGVNTLFNLALYTLSGNKFRRAFLSIFYCEHWLNKARSLLHLPSINKAGTGMPVA